MSSTKPRPGRTGRHADYRHVRAVIPIDVYDRIRRHAVETGIQMEDAYPLFLEVGVNTLCPAKPKPRRVATVSAR